MSISRPVTVTLTSAYYAVQSVHDIILGEGEFGEGFARFVHIRPTDEGLDVCGLSERTSWSPAISAATGGLTRRQQPQGALLPQPRAFLLPLS